MGSSWAKSIDTDMWLAPEDKVVLEAELIRPDETLSETVRKRDVSIELGVQSVSQH
jgi:hypothetical protein